MIAFVFKLLGPQTMGWILPLLAAALFGLHTLAVHNAYQSGVKTERLTWQEKQQRANIRAAQRAVAQQQIIDAAEQRYAIVNEAAGHKLLSLQEALRNASKKNSDRNRCVVVPRELRDQFNAVGRTQPEASRFGSHPAAMPGGN